MKILKLNVFYTVNAVTLVLSGLGYIIDGLLSHDYASTFYLIEIY